MLYNMQRNIQHICCLLRVPVDFVQRRKCDFPCNCTPADQSASVLHFLYRYGCKKCNSVLIGQKFITARPGVIALLCMLIYIYNNYTYYYYYYYYYYCIGFMKIYTMFVCLFVCLFVAYIRNFPLYFQVVGRIWGCGFLV